jgi:hypothetical protein
MATLSCSSGGAGHSKTVAPAINPVQRITGWNHRPQPIWRQDRSLRSIIGRCGGGRSNAHLSIDETMGFLRIISGFAEQHTFVTCE